MKIGLGTLVLGVWVVAFGQAPVISSFSQNGELVCTNLAAGSMAMVEWASSVTGPWTNNWAGLDAVMVNSNGMIRVSVPMFYRVRGTAQGTNPAPKMALVPAGSFAMGEGDRGECPLHTVYVSAFYMGRTEVTKAYWDEVKTWATAHGYWFENAGSGKAANHPVQMVSWYDMVKWCNALSEKEGRVPAYYTEASQMTVYRSGILNLQNDWVRWNAGYRLPTEAEWEKAARGGASGHRFPWSDVDTITHGQANYCSSTNNTFDVSLTRGYHPTFNDSVEPYTSPVGYFAANGYGLYDMAGNLWESCWDRYGPYLSNSQSDPHGPASGSDRVSRGGSWDDSAWDCPAACRGYNNPTTTGNWRGFRVVLPASQ
jgi:formylglycine-generating enzyme required for sulfatase activity